MMELPETSPPPAPPASPREAHWARATMWMVIMLVLVGGAVLIFRSCAKIPSETISKTGEAVRNVGAVVRDVAAAFRQGTITTSFVSYATTIEGMQYLQFGKVNQMEIFTRSDERTFAGYITLPEVVVEARAPIEYTYYVDLNGTWRFVLEDGVIQAYAPPIQFNKPSIDVSRMEFEVRKGKVGTTQVQEDLKRSISYLAREKARQNVSLIRDSGRSKIAEFVETWLSRSFTDGKKYPVKVHFPDDKQPASLVATNGPALLRE